MKKWLLRIGLGCVVMMACVCLVLGALAVDYQIRWRRIGVASDLKTLEFEGLEREYRVYIPDTMTEPAPVVLVLHGGGGDAVGIEKVTYGRFNDLSDQYGFMVVYPQGVDDHWNDGRETEWRAQRENINDVGFILAILDDLEQDYPLDRAHVFATGISNGGQMSMRLACETTEQFAAIAVVTANLSEDLHTTCQPSRPIPVLILNGSDDPLVDPDGGIMRVARTDVTYLSQAATLEFWLNNNQCSADALTETLPDADPDDGTRVTVSRYGPCTAAVTLYAIEGGGHTWPDGFQYLPTLLIGRTTHDINGAEVIWDFFAAQLGDSSP